MITLNHPSYTATRIHPHTSKADSERTQCRRCGITFNTTRRPKHDRTHCRDCKPYLNGEQR